MTGSVRKRKAARKKIRWVMAVTVILSIVLTVRIIQLHRENEDLSVSAAALQESAAAERAEQEILEEKVNRELTLDEIIEIARERFGLVFPNEILFVPEK